jgi:hypothetical protein
MIYLDYDLIQMDGHSRVGCQNDFYWRGVAKMVRPSRNVKDGNAIIGSCFVVSVMVYDLILGTVIA